MTAVSPQPPIAAAPPAGLSFRLVAARAPYWRAGIGFFPLAGRAYGVIVVPSDWLDVERVEQLLADEHIDVSVGRNDLGWFPVDGFDAIADVACRLLLAETPPADPVSFIPGPFAWYLTNPPELGDQASGQAEQERRDTIAILAEHSRAGGPMGDEEIPPGEPAPPPGAVGGQPQGDSTVAPETAAPNPSPAELAAFVAKARTRAGATIKVGGPPPRKTVAKKPKP